MLWFDGRWIAEGEAAIDPADRGLLLADGLFETMRAEAGQVRRLAAHLARLRQGASVLGLRVPLDDAALGDALAATLAANGLDRAGAALRLTLTRGPGPRGLLPPEPASPTLMIAAFPLPPPRPPADAVLVESVRRNEHSPTSRLKTLAYLDQVLALREARAAGGDEAILRCTAGRLACASAANLFLVIDGQARTPPVEDGALPGVTRRRLLAIGPAAGTAVTASPLPGEALQAAAEAFVTSSLAGIRPIRTLSGRSLPAPGPLTERLAALLAADNE
ncbi:MAG TPA: aminotransferase class IV [Geminicoccaceae bacterium]|nr:aminotransferase class IV [Geminicoccus sp.]HMU52158.1 aminotransferase class IV [Geminicoccaceae bacterium]